MIKYMKAGFVSGSIFCIDDKGNYRLREHDYKSLAQWIELFDEVVFYFTQVPFDISLNDWAIVKDNKFSFIAICNHSDSVLVKRKKIKKVVVDCETIDIYYYRLPSYEATLFHYYQDKNIPYYVELHGDHETAIMSSPNLWVIKFPLSKYLASFTKKICQKASFVYSIGEMLMNKYVSENVPQLVTTNHLTSITEYPEECPYHILSNPIQILFVGAIQERKGLIFLFKALEIMHNDGVNFIMNIVGSGLQKDSLEKFAKTKGFDAKVKFWGQISHGKQLYNIYRTSDLFVLPSISAEGVPRVIHEAMIFGCPVVASDIGSVNWQLSGSSGIVVESGNVQLLHSAIMSVLTDPTLRRSLIYNGYEKSKLFSLEAQKNRNNIFAKEQLKKIFSEP